MFPTISDLNKPTNDNDGVVIRAANDSYLEKSMSSTLDRVITKHNLHTDKKLNAVNDKVDAIVSTMGKLIDKFNYNAGAPRWIERRNGINDNDVVPDALGSVTDQTGIVSRTMDRIMDRHNYHDYSKNKANDNYRDVLGDYLFMPEELPEFANDWKSGKKKPDIYGHTSRLKPATAQRAKSSRRKSEDSDNYSNEEMIDVLHSIEANTAETASLLTMLVGSFDEAGIDNLRRQEYEREEALNSKASSAVSTENGSEREDKKEESQSWLKTGIMAALGGAGILTTGAEDALNNLPENATPEQKAKALQSGLAGGIGAALGVKPEYIADLQSQITGGGKDVGPTVTGNFTGREAAFIDMISRREGAGYDTEFDNGNYGSAEKMFGKKLSELTIEEAQQLQKQINKNTRAAGIGRNSRGQIVGTSAIGKGQWISGTMVETLEGMGYTKDQFSTLKFTPELQDRMILSTAIKKRGLDPNKIDQWSNSDLVKLGLEWESLDVSKGKISMGDLKEEIKKIASASTARRAGGVTPLTPKSEVESESSFLGGLFKTKRTKDKGDSWADTAFQFTSKIMQVYDDVTDNGLFVIKKDSPTARKLESTIAPRGKALNQTSQAAQGSKKDKPVVINNTTNVAAGGKATSAPKGKPATQPKPSLWEQFTDWFD
jgi:hypothetical protein